DYGFGVQLIGYCETRRKVLPLSGDASRFAVAPEPRHNNRVGGHIVSRTLPWVHTLIREPRVPTQSVTEGQLRSGPPGVLRKIEHAPLQIFREGVRVLLKENKSGRQAHQESGWPQHGVGHASGG